MSKTKEENESLNEEIKEIRKISTGNHTRLVKKTPHKEKALREQVAADTPDKEKAKQMLDMREGAFVYGGGKKSPEHSEGEKSAKEKSSKGGLRHEMSIEDTSRQ